MSESKRAPGVLILVALSMTSPLSLNILVPSMPGMVSALDSDVATIQLTLTFFLIGIATGQLIYGPLSDRFGRRPVLLWGLWIFLIASVAVLIAPTAGLVVVGRFAQAIGSCAAMVLTRAIILDVYERDRAASVMAYVTMAMAVAPALSPAIGGQLDYMFGWRAVALVMVLFGVTVLVFSWPFVHETNHRRLGHLNLWGVGETYRTLLSSRAFVGYAFSAAFSTATFFAFLGGAPYVVIEILGATPRAYGYFFIMVAGGFMIGSYTAGRFSSTYGVERMMAVGQTIAGSGMILMLVVVAVGAVGHGGLISIFGPMFVISMGHGMIQPNAIAGAMSSHPHIAGAASGLTGFLQMSTGGILSFLVGLLIADTAWPMVTVMAAATLLSIGFFVWVRAVPAHRAVQAADTVVAPGTETGKTGGGR